MNSNELSTTFWKVDNLGSVDRARQLIRELERLPGVVKVDVNFTKQAVRLLSNTTLLAEEVVARVAVADFTLTLNPLLSALWNLPAVADNESVRSDSSGARQITLSIAGMHCQACELTIERKFKTVSGVGKVEVNAARGTACVECCAGELDITALQATIADEGYQIISRTQKNQSQEVASPDGSKRLGFWPLVGAFVIVLIIGKMMSRWGLLTPNIGVLNYSSLGAVFILGLVAASSSCVAVAGGLLLSSIKTFRERYQLTTVLGRLTPVFLFVGGRIVGYGILGGLIGLLGKSLSPSPTVTGLITILAATYMLVMGLDMLGYAPQWLKRLLPRMPKNLGHKVMDAQGNSHAFMPAMLGAGTFFLPCGFTQALQLYALTTGSFWISALLLGVFALGTAPSLIALGWASSSFTGKLGQIFFSLAGATVVVLGMWNLQNGLTIAGYPLQWPSWSSASATSTGGVTFDGKQQIMRMTADLTNGYTPDKFVVKQGIPVRWEIDGSRAGGCQTILQAPQLGIKKLLSPTETNIIEFTPQKIGNFAFSCSMGMYRGQISVVPSS